MSCDLLLLGSRLKTVILPKVGVASFMEGFIGTGNLRSRSGLNLQQVMNIVIVIIMNIN